jgi:hypothetical protein
MAIAVLLFQRKVLIPGSIQVETESRYFLFQVSIKGGVISFPNLPGIQMLKANRAALTNKSKQVDFKQARDYSPAAGDPRSGPHAHQQVRYSAFRT